MEHLVAISRVVQRHLKVVLRDQEAIFGYLGGIWGASGSQFGGTCRYLEVFRGHQGHLKEQLGIIWGYLEFILRHLEAILVHLVAI